jgi:hypothetical protein
MNEEASILALTRAGPNPPPGNASFLESGRGVIRTDEPVDSLGRVLEETQASFSMTHQSWASYPATGFTYDDGRQLTIGYDLLYRKNAIHETSGGASIAAWQFFGNRTATITLGNGVVCSFMNNDQTRSAIQAGLPTPPWGSGTSDQLGFDGAGRVIAKRYLLPHGGASPMPTTLVVGFTTAYDRSSNKLFERHLHAESRSHLYPAYDSPDRLLQYQRGALAVGGRASRARSRSRTPTSSAPTPWTAWATGTTPPTRPSAARPRPNSAGTTT